MTGDNGYVNGLGVGTVVGLGTIVGLGITAPTAQVIEYVATFAFYGGVAGFLFELYRFAFSWRPPFS